MCGIAGMVGVGDTDSVRRMLGALARRGPDGEGVEQWSTATLGHRRLSIFDLSDAGRQPMLVADGSVGIVFNGAIYNFHELRRQLETIGRRFRTRTDTEVILEGYQAWGIDTLVAKLRGMFAIGLWDDRKRTLFLVRDRLGVKPLIYCAHGGGLVFASTARAVRAALGADIDPHAVAEYLEFGYVTDARVIYRGMKKVSAASIVEWRDGALTERQYWRPAQAAALGADLGDAVAETEHRFLDAVKMRLHADVPVAALLSGGVDSSLVCWAISKLGADIRAFTIGTPGAEEDETSGAQNTARALGIEHDVIELSAEDVPTVDDVVAAYGEPFGCASGLGMMRVAQAIKPVATVLLTGDGGDDCFLGYPEHRHFWMAERAARWIPDGVAHWWTASSRDLPREGPFRRVGHFIDYATGGMGAVARIHDGLPYYERHGLLGERLENIGIRQRSLPMSPVSARRLLAEFLEYDRRTRFVGEYLTKVDGGAMFHALEARSPFLDHELWDYAQSLPYALRLHRRSKAVLREIIRRRLGDEVASRPKRGFGVPVRRWLAGKWRVQFEELLRDSELERQGWIRAQPVMEQLRIAERRGTAPNQLWYLYVLEAWLRRECTPATIPPLAGQTRLMV